MAIKYDPILDALREADTSGSSDTASNLGTGVGVFSYKSSGVFYFNSLANSSTIGVSTASGGNITFNLLSVPSALIPDPLNINNLSVNSSASINRLDVQNTYFSLTGGATPLVEGQLSWDSALGHLGYGLPGGNVELAIGMENVLPRRCKNSSGTTMTKGTVVYISSVSGNDPVVSRARANTDATSAFTIGVCAEDIPDGQKGWITTYGLVSGLNLSSYTAGDTVYLSGTTAGEFTKTKPYAPTHYVRIGIVTKATSSGDLYVQVLNGFEMDELHNVSAQSAASGDILRYNGTTSLWETQSLIQPQSKALITGQYLDSYDSTTGLFTSSVFNSANATHNNLSGLQGGTANEYNHLTNAQVTNLNNQSGSNTGDVTVTDSATIDFTLTGQALTGSVIPSGINITSLGMVSTISLASGQLLQYDGTNFVNITPLYPNFYGKNNTDPSIAGVRNGDQYWNNLDNKVQIYIDKWLELNGADRLDAENTNPLQAENGAYLQVEFQYVSGAFTQENIFPEIP